MSYDWNGGRRPPPGRGDYYPNPRDGGRPPPRDDRDLYYRGGHPGNDGGDDRDRGEYMRGPPRRFDDNPHPQHYYRGPPGGGSGGGGGPSRFDRDDRDRDWSGGGGPSGMSSNYPSRGGHGRFNSGPPAVSGWRNSSGGGDYDDHRGSGPGSRFDDDSRPIGGGFRGNRDNIRDMRDIRDSGRSSPPPLRRGGSPINKRSPDRDRPSARLSPPNAYRRERSRSASRSPPRRFGASNAPAAAPLASSVSSRYSPIRRRSRSPPYNRPRSRSSSPILGRESVSRFSNSNSSSFSASSMPLSSSSSSSSAAAATALLQPIPVSRTASSHISPLSKPQQQQHHLHHMPSSLASDAVFESSPPPVTQQHQLQRSSSGSDSRSIFDNFDSWSSPAKSFNSSAPPSVGADIKNAGHDLPSNNSRSVMFPGLATSSFSSAAAAASSSSSSSSSIDSVALLESVASSTVPQLAQTLQSLRPPPSSNIPPIQVPSASTASSVDAFLSSLSTSPLTSSVLSALSSPSSAANSPSSAAAISSSRIADTFDALLSSSSKATPRAIKQRDPQFPTTPSAASNLLDFPGLDSLPNYSSSPSPSASASASATSPASLKQQQQQQQQQQQKKKIGWGQGLLAKTPAKSAPSNESTPSAPVSEGLEKDQSQQPQQQQQQQQPQQQQQQEDAEMASPNQVSPASLDDMTPVAINLSPTMTPTSYFEPELIKKESPLAPASGDLPPPSPSLSTPAAAAAAPTVSSSSSEPIDPRSSRVSRFSSDNPLNSSSSSSLPRASFSSTIPPPVEVKFEGLAPAVPLSYVPYRSRPVVAPLDSLSQASPRQPQQQHHFSSSSHSNSNSPMSAASHHSLSSYSASPSPSPSSAPPLSAASSTLSSAPPLAAIKSEPQQQQKAPMEPPPPTPTTPVAPPLPSKEELLVEMERVDLEIARLEQELEDAKRPKIPEQSVVATAVVDGAPPKSKAKQIYTENKVKAKVNSRLLEPLAHPAYKPKDPSVAAPLYTCPADSPLFKETVETGHRLFFSVLSIVKQRRMEHIERVAALSSRYKHLEEEYAELLKKRAERKSGKKSDEPSSSTTPAAAAASAKGSGKQQPESSSSSRRANRASMAQQTAPGAVNSEADFERIMAQLEDEDRKNNRWINCLADVPDMILDPYEVRALKYMDRNGLVEDPMAEDKERRARERSWTVEEKRTFISKFFSFPKNFRKISDFLPNRSVFDCIMFYFNYKNSNEFKDMQKELRRERRAPRRAVDETLKSSASLLAKTSIFNTGRGRTTMNSFSIVDDFSGLDPTGSLPSAASVAAASGAFSPLNQYQPIASSPMQRGGAVGGGLGILSSDNFAEDIIPVVAEPWTDADRDRFLELFTQHGRDFNEIAAGLGNKTTTQCKSFFTTNRRRYNLDKLATLPPGAAAAAIASVVAAAAAAAASAATISEDGTPVARRGRGGRRGARGGKASKPTSSSSSAPSSAATAAAAADASSSASLLLNQDENSNSGLLQDEDSQSGLPSVSVTSSFAATAADVLSAESHPEILQQQSVSEELHDVSADLMAFAEAAALFGGSENNSNNMENSSSREDYFEQQQIDIDGGAEQDQLLMDFDGTGTPSGAAGGGGGKNKRVVSYWTPSEKEMFLESFQRHGRNWKAVADDLKGTKSLTQIKNFYQNYKQKLGLEKIAEEMGFRSRRGPSHSSGSQSSFSSASRSENPDGSLSGEATPEGAGGPEDGGPIVLLGEDGTAKKKRKRHSHDSSSSVASGAGGGSGGDSSLSSFRSAKVPKNQGSSSAYDDDLSTAALLANVGGSGGNAEEQIQLQHQQQQQQQSSTSVESLMEHLQHQQYQQQAYYQMQMEQHQLHQQQFEAHSVPGLPPGSRVLPPSAISMSSYPGATAGVPMSRIVSGTVSGIGMSMGSGRGSISALLNPPTPSSSVSPPSSISSLSSPVLNHSFAVPPPPPLHHGYSVVPAFAMIPHSQIQYKQQHQQQLMQEQMQMQQFQQHHQQQQQQQQSEIMTMQAEEEMKQAQVLEQADVGSNSSDLYASTTTPPSSNSAAVDAALMEALMNSPDPSSSSSSSPPPALVEAVEQHQQQQQLEYQATPPEQQQDEQLEQQQMVPEPEPEPRLPEEQKHQEDAVVAFPPLPEDSSTAPSEPPIVFSAPSEPQIEPQMEIAE